jgi:hypothetical protein
MLSSRSCVLILLVGVLVQCKWQNDKASPPPPSASPADVAPLEDARAQPANSQPTTNTREFNPEFALHVFADDERIFIFPADYLANVKNVTGDASSEDSLMYYDAFHLESAVGKALSAAIARKTSAAESLSLTDDGETIAQGIGVLVLSAAVGMAGRQVLSNQRPIIRKFEGMQDWYRTLTKGKDYKIKYFEKAIAKKWQDPAARQFGKMTEIVSPTLAKKGMTDIPPLGGASVRLGMLPDEAILKELKRDFSEDKFDIVSVIENFEKEFAVKKINESLPAAGKLTPQASATKIDYEEGRFRMDLDFGAGAGSLGVRKWTQFSSPDRTMMTPQVLKGAMDEVITAMRGGQGIFVHCKSGKGRSATVVVGARVAVLIDAAKARGIEVDKSLIEELIEEQTAQVKLQRKEMDVSSFQKFNLREVLYSRAGILK